MTRLRFQRSVQDGMLGDLVQATGQSLVRGAPRAVAHQKPGPPPAALQCWRLLPVSWRRGIRRSLPPALSGPLERRTRPAGHELDFGLLSVVIPLHNVQEYLDACLTSIINQTYHRLEIIIVDDGSSDDSVAIAETYRRRDRRITLIRQPRSGVGAARNAGIARARGDYVTFADSDDTVPRKAYETMMRSLHSSGSDFVVGALNRLSGNRHAAPAWAAKVHCEDRIAIQVTDFPEVLQDVFAWNKVFRRSFWDDRVGNFPEGVLYEDQETTGRAYLHAGSFDVLKAVVYNWRIRSDGSSITQQKSSLRDLSDRLKVTARMLHLMDSEAPVEIRDSWLAKVLGHDLGLYYVQVPRVEEDYWNVLRTGVTALATSAGQSVWSQLSVHQRVLVSLLRQDRRKDFEQVIVSNAASGMEYPLVLTATGWSARPAYLPLLEHGVEKSLLRVEGGQLNVRAELTCLDFTEGLLWIGGHAYIPGVDPRHTASSLTMELVEISTGETISLAIEPAPDAGLDQRTADASTSYAGAAFRAVIDLDLLRLGSGKGPAGPSWYVRLALTAGGATVAGTFAHRHTSGSAATFPLFPVQENQRFVCGFSQQHGLTLRTERHRRYAEYVCLTGRDVALSASMLPGDDPVQVTIECARLGLSVKALPASGTELDPVFEARIPALPRSAGRVKEYRWTIRAEAADGTSHALAWRGSDTDLGHISGAGESLRLCTSADGYLELHDRQWQIVAEDCRLSDDGTSLIVEGRVSFADRDASLLSLPNLVLASDHGAIAPARTYWVHHARQFVAEFPIAGDRWKTMRSAPESGLYTLRCITARDGSMRGAYWVPVARTMEATLPREIQHPATNIRISRTPRAAGLAVHCGPPYQPDERGKLAQSKLQRNVPSLLKQGVKAGTVLFETFAGKSVSDSGLGIFNEMVRRGDDRPKYWTVRDSSISVPPGAEPVLIYSRDWYRLTHTAEYVVNNNNFPHFYRKNPGQKYIQTWHGTPLKRIGNDMPTSRLSVPYLELMKREAGYWDYLLAQNPYSGSVLPQAFGFEGRTLTMGYPRNDALFGDPAKKRAEAVRTAMGFSDQQKVVLYAPTWRDDVRESNNQCSLVNHLDMNAASDMLGSDYVFLLRGHHNVAAQRSTLGMAAMVDVTDYPDINDLYLAADILVTDYSSVMFDFCVTGKPIYFLTPDLQHYQEKVRGFYFDFAEVAPGPLVATTAELAEAILADTAANRYFDRYEAFRDRFAGMDDGGASARVYDAVWEGK